MSVSTTVQILVISFLFGKVEVLGPTPCVCICIYKGPKFIDSIKVKQILNHGYVLVRCRTLDKTISNLEMELAAARAAQESIRNGAPLSENIKKTESSGRRKYRMVVGINTAFSSRKRRDSVRATWMPQGL